ncbi:MAG: divalent metal cation transporter [Bryobacterales bacterium]|nr:divalent metal cation transporter [Bryobacterales bacterium]
MDWNLIKRTAASLTPGIFIIGYVVGTGSVTTMSSAGASYGMSLTWTLALASMFTHLMIVGISRLTIISGETLLHLFRRHFGIPVTVLIVVSLAATQLTSIIGVMAIVVDVLREWSANALGISIDPLGAAVGFTVLLLSLYWVGRHAFFLKVLASLVGVMGLAFFFTAGTVLPDFRELAAGFVPSIPDSGNPRLLIAGMVGTTMASVVLFTRSVLVKEEGWQVRQLPHVTRDSAFSMTVLFFINAAIMACAAGTLHRQGMEIDAAIDMVKTLEPLAGGLAAGGVVIGIVAAGLSSLFPNYLLGPWMAADFLGLPRDMGRRAFRAMVVGASLFGLVVPVLGGSPVQIMIASQAVSPVAMPLLALFVLILLNKKGVVGDLRPTLALNAGLCVTVVFSFYMCLIALAGFFGG